MARRNFLEEDFPRIYNFGHELGTHGLGDSLIVYPSCVVRRAVTHCVGPRRASCVVLRPFGYVVRRVMGPGYVVRHPLGHDPEKSCSGRSMLKKQGKTMENKERKKQTTKQDKQTNKNNNYPCTTKTQSKLTKN